MCGVLEEHIASAFSVISKVTGMKNGFVVWESSEQTYEPTCFDNPDSCYFSDIQFCLSEYVICFSTRSAWPVKQCPETEHCGMLNSSITLKDLCKIVYKISNWEENNCHIHRTIITGI